MDGNRTPPNNSTGGVRNNETKILIQGKKITESRKTTGGSALPLKKDTSGLTAIGTSSKTEDSHYQLAALSGKNCGVSAGKLKTKIIDWFATKSVHTRTI